MKPEISFKFVVILIVLKCRGLYGQIDGCNSSKIEHMHNVCDSSNYLVYISESVCSTNGGKNCLCILVDNRNREYDGQDVEIEIEHSSPSYLWKQANQTLYNDSMEVKFKIVPGINRIYLQPVISSSPIPKVISLKIDSQDICKTLMTQRTKQIVNTWFIEHGYIKQNNAPIQVATQTKQIQQVRDTQDDRYRYLDDCIQRRNYTANSERFCPNDDGSHFIIEKRYLWQGKPYWCISVNNEKNVFSTANRLQISYAKQNIILAWMLSDSYRQSNNAESTFQLGSSQTNVAILVNNDEHRGLYAVKIDGQSICNYFDPILVNDYFQIVSQDDKQPAEPPKISRLNTNCGIKPVSLSHQQLNTNLGDWPWHAAIFKFQTKTNLNYICGGTLIGLKTIVTAANCVIDLNLIVIPDRIIVELGRNDLLVMTQAAQQYKVSDVIAHESYNLVTHANNIAILILANLVQLTSYVNFICLPDPNFMLRNRFGKMVGWGPYQSNQLQAELKEVSLPVIDNATCLSSNRKIYEKYLTNTSFCAGISNDTNVCRGDGGAGLVFEFGNQWFLGGVTSLAVVSAKTIDDACDKTNYAIFTDVTKFVKWIQQYSH